MRCPTAALDRSEAPAAGEGAAGGPLRPSLGPTWSFVPDVSLLVVSSREGGRDVISTAVLKSGRPYLGALDSEDAAPEALRWGAAPAGKGGGGGVQ